MQTYITIFSPGSLPSPVSDFDSQVTIEYARATAVGFSHTINPRNKVAADVVCYGWSGAFDAIGLKLENPTNPALARTIITESTPGMERLPIT